MKYQKIFCITFLLIFPVTSFSQTGFIKGADVSFLNQLEENGAVFRDSGFAKDPLEILKSHGFNAIRLRLWVNPSGGYNNLARTLTQAARLKAKGFKFLLDIHYSDSWADPSQQTKPAAWQSVSGNALADSVRQYTSRVMAALKNQNTTPDMVQIGNEITSGMLWNDGCVSGTFNTPSQWTAFAALLKAGIQGVRDATRPVDSVKIIIHIERSGDSAACRYFFDKLAAEAVPFDVIGLSYYPWWHGSLGGLSATLVMLANRYPQNIIVAETGYPWTLSYSDTTNNVVGLASQLLAGYPATVSRQRQFLTDLIATLQAAPLGKVNGLFYWEPDDISLPTLGSSWENVTLFDFGGNTLESILAFESAQTSVKREGNHPYRYVLSQNYPNPFNPTTTIRFEIAATSYVSLHVYDVLGRDVATLVNEKKSAGRYHAVFDGSKLASGIYFYRLTAGSTSEVRKMVLVK
jgi:arabinogalactan endo-1,4-beta-galactosidase